MLGVCPQPQDLIPECPEGCDWDMPQSSSLSGSPDIPPAPAMPLCLEKWHLRVLRNFKLHLLPLGEFLSSGWLDVVPISEWFVLTVNALGKVTGDLIQVKKTISIVYLSRQCWLFRIFLLLFRQCLESFFFFFFAQLLFLKPLFWFFSLVSIYPLHLSFNTVFMAKPIQYHYIHPSFIPKPKNNSKWIMDVNGKHKTIKLRREKIHVILLGQRLFRCNTESMM